MVSSGDVSEIGPDDSDEILRHAEKKSQTPNPHAPAATVSASSPASTRPSPALLSRVNGTAGPAPRPPMGPGIASTNAPAASNLAAAYRNNPQLRGVPIPPAQGRQPPQGIYDPRAGRSAQQPMQNSSGRRFF